MNPLNGEHGLAFLASLQLADSFFPSGLYTLSHGLEAFVQSGQVDANNLEALLADYLRYSLGSTDGVALACAHRAGEEDTLRLALLADVRLTAVKLAREARETSRRVGRQLLTLSRQVFGGELLNRYAGHVGNDNAPGNHAVVLGLVMATLGIPRDQAVMSELYTFSSSFVAAAVRLAMIDHRLAQVILHQLKPVIAEIARANCTKSVQDIASCAPLIDVMAMRHERAELRLFMS